MPQEPGAPQDGQEGAADQGGAFPAGGGQQMRLEVPGNATEPDTTTTRAADREEVDPIRPEEGPGAGMFGRHPPKVQDPTGPRFPQDRRVLP